MRFLLVLAGLSVCLPSFAQIYRCEDANGVIEYSNKPSGSKDKACKSVDLPTITTIPAPKLPPPKANSAKAAPAAGNGAGREGSTRVDESAQRTRDNDRRRIIEDELRKEESKLVELRKEYRNGEPERLGDERNYQKYLDRVQRMKDEIARSESNVDSLKKELGNIR